MTGSQLLADIRRLLEGRDLLQHPFYVRWQRGEVTADELRAYAGQYRHFEAAFPGLLRGIAEGTEDRSARALIQRNLDDETGGPATHLELFDDFADAIGASGEVAATPATRQLLTTYADLVAAGPAAGLAAVVTYEVQFPGVAAAKAEGLRRDHGLDHSATRFWDVHAELDADHAAWGAEALARLPGVDTWTAASRRAADAWWRFLDEREAAAPTGALPPPC